MPRLARGNGYDLVIRHLAVGRVSFGGILEDSTYTFCQMSYDVGHDPSIVSQTEAFQASRNFIPYARYKTSFERRKSGLHTTPVPREKLYAIPPIAACGPEKKGPNPPRSAATEAPAGETQAGSEPTGSPSASRPAARHEAAAEGPLSPPVPSAGSQGRDTAEGPRPARHRGEMAGGLGEGPRVRREGRSAPPEMVLDRPLSVHERISASRLRNLVPAGVVPVAVPPDARLQRPPSPGLPLHGPPDPRRREARGREGTEAMGHPAQDGDPGPRDPEVRRPDALDRGLPRGDDRGPEGPRGRGRLDAVLHHDAPQPALRRVRPLAVPSSQGRRLRQDRQAPGDLVPERPGADRGPRPDRGGRRGADGVHAPQVPPRGRPVPRRGDDPAGDRLRADEPLGRSEGPLLRRKGRRGTMDPERARREETLRAGEDGGHRVNSPRGRPDWQRRGRARDQPRDPGPSRLLHRPGPRDGPRDERAFRCAGRLRCPPGPATRRGDVDPLPP